MTWKFGETEVDFSAPIAAEGPKGNGPASDELVGDLPPDAEFSLITVALVSAKLGKYRRIKEMRVGFDGQLLVIIYEPNPKKETLSDG